MLKNIKGPVRIITALLLTTFTTYSVASNSNKQVEEILQEAWEQQIQNSPLMANSTGDRRFRDALDDVSEQSLDKQVSSLQALQKRFAAIDSSSLTGSAITNHEIFTWVFEHELALLQSDWRYVRFNSFEGWHSTFASTAAILPFEKISDYDDYINRLKQFPRYADQQVTLLRRGLDKGLAQPCSILKGYQDSIQAYIKTDPTKSSLYAPFKRFPPNFDQETQSRLSATAKKVLSEDVNNGYRQYATFFTKEYFPKCRTNAGLSSVIGGSALYERFIQYYTTLDTDAETVHALGLSEVKRILADMHKVKNDANFDGSFPEFLKFLRTDKQFYPTDAEEYLNRIARISKKIDGLLPEFFSFLPRNPYGISVIPEAIAPKTTTAYYHPGAADGTRAGQYFVNTSKLDSRPYYELPALSLHEAVPGHHLQISLQNEMQDQPTFRRFYNFQAYTEGWALYTEYLGIEMGMYTTPYERFGRLTYEMWRACRLVVDTGIHAKGWTRQQAIDYMAKHTALSIHNISAEVDRYISWPGQALAYKHGELKIRELRQRAEKTLGDKFRLREFHTAVLTLGAVPLGVLEAHIDDWISQQR